MGIKVREGGAWVDPTTLARRVTVGSSKVWQDFTSIKRRVAGAWVQVWPPEGVFLGNYNVNSATYSGYRVNGSGFAEYSTDGTNYFTIEQWLTSGSASSFAVMAHADSGTPGGDPLDQWIECSASPEWHVDVASTSAQLTVSIGTIEVGSEVAITDDTDAAFLDSDGNAITDSTLTVTPIDTATITLSTVQGIAP